MVPVNAKDDFDVLALLHYIISISFSHIWHHVQNSGIKTVVGNAELAASVHHAHEDFLSKSHELLNK